MTQPPFSPLSPARTSPSRRALIKAAGLITPAVVLAGTAPRADARPTAAAPTPAQNPFTLGVASGDPLPDGFVIWTRLALEPTADDGLGGMPSRTYQLNWQVATDERFATVVKAGSVAAQPDSAHAVHVEVHGLRPGREYWYRFKLGRHLSPTGRSLTTPAYGAAVSSLAMSFVSCSNFPAGYFTAYRRLAEDRPDLILHLGDYQYEYGAADNALGRAHVGPETVTLANYRQRQAQYKSDLDLQAAHAIAPWLAVWDDHEVDNNYADDVAENAASMTGFLDRRAAAYRAYYENMPLRRSSLPAGPDLQLFRRVQWGQLANFHMLDTRQYRSDQACGDGRKYCPEAADPSRSLPGMEQERWLLDGFAKSTQRWDVLGQQVFFGRRNSDASDAPPVSMDSWDGYPASRQRVTQGWVDAGVRNPIVLTGDVHAHWACDLKAQPDPDAPIVGSEFITSSITSGGDGYDKTDGRHAWADWNPELRFWTNLRGYVNTTITPEAFTVDYRCVEKVTAVGAQAFSRATFVIEDGVRGMHQSADNPLPAPPAPASADATRSAAPSGSAPTSIGLRTREQIIADTLASEG